MAQAYKCDVCGKFYIGERTKQIAIGTNNPCLNERILKYDVCFDCEKSFFLWKDSRNPDYKSAFEDKEDQ